MNTVARSEESNFGHAELILTLSLASLLVVIASYFTEKRKTEETIRNQAEKWYFWME